MRLSKTFHLPRVFWMKRIASALVFSANSRTNDRVISLIEQGYSMKLHGDHRLIESNSNFKMKYQDSNSSAEWHAILM